MIKLATFAVQKMYFYPLKTVKLITIYRVKVVSIDLKILTTTLTTARVYAVLALFLVVTIKILQTFYFSKKREQKTVNLRSEGL